MLAAAGQVVVQTLVLFFLYRYLIHSIGVEQIGVWAIVLASASTARISELGLASSVTRFIAACRPTGEAQRARETLQTAALTLAAAMGVLLALAYPLFKWLLPHILPAQWVSAGGEVLPFALLSLWFATIGSVWMAGLDGYLRSDLRAATMIACTLLHMAVAMASVAHFGLIGLAGAQVVQSVVLFVAGWLIVRSVARIDAWLPVCWRRARFREMLGYGVNFQINSLVMLLFEPITKVLLGRYGEVAAAGYFELAQRMVARVRALIVETNRVIVPVLAGMQDTDANARELYGKNVRYLFLLLTPLFAGLLALLPGISQLWIGSYQSMFVVISVCLAVAWYANSATAPAYFAYLANGRLRWLTVSHVFMGTANAILGLVLGAWFGWLGVIAAFGISLVVGSIIPVITYHKERGISARQVFARQDASLAAFCVLIPAAALTVHGAMYSAGTYQAAHMGLFVAATAAIVWATFRHPLTRQLWSAAREVAHGKSR